MRILTLLSVTVAAASLSGCAVTKTVLDTKSEITVQRSLEDVTAARAIRARMARVEGHDLNDISVDVVQGNVVLAGATPNTIDKKEAERIAWSAPRVSKVGNEIYVGKSNGMGSKVKDELIATAVRTKLASSNSVRNLNFKVETRDNVVYLMGVARSKEELAEAARLASITRGVKEVVSYVTVKGDIPNGYGAGYSGYSGYSGSPQRELSSMSRPSMPYSAPSLTLGPISEPMPYSAPLYAPNAHSTLDAQPTPLDPGAPLAYRPGSTELDADALQSGDPVLRDPYTGEEIILPPGVKTLPYIPPSPGSLGAGALPLPPGAAEKMAQQAMRASPNDPGARIDLTAPQGESVTLTAPYTLDPSTGKPIPVVWDGSQWVGVYK